MKLCYVGPRDTEFSSGVCPSGENYAVVPGAEFDADPADAPFLLAQVTPSGVALYAAVKPAKTEPKSEVKGGL